ncbi:MAG: TolC family protein [Thermodesulfobacteriota bacterium]
MKKVIFLWSFTLLTFDSLANDNIFTLEDVIERSLTVSPNLGVLSKELDISESKLKQARAKKYPQFTGTVLSGGIFNVIRADLFQPVYTFGKISSSEKAAEKGVEATMATIREGKSDTVEKATEAYYKLQLAYTLNEFAIEGKATTEKTLNRLEELLEIGSPKATQTDKLNLRVLLSNINKEVGRSVNAVELSKAVLKRMLGIENDFDIDSHSLEPIAFEINNLTFYKEKALKERPQIIATEAGLQAKEFLVKKAKSEYFPTIFVGGTLRYSQSTIFEDTIIGGAGIGINQVLNFSISADISEAKAEYTKSLKEKDVLLDEIDLDIEKAYIDVIENKDNIDNDKEGLEAARTLLLNTASNYDLGIGTIKDLINALSTFLNEGGEYYQSVYLHNLSVARLKRVTGQS